MAGVGVYDCSWSFKLISVVTTEDHPAVCIATTRESRSHADNDVFNLQALVVFQAGFAGLSSGNSSL